MSEAIDLLIVAAFAPELAGLGDLLGAQLRNTVQGIRVAAETVGIGLPAAAGGTVARIEAHKPRAVVLVGTCGCYPGRGLAIGDVLVATRIHLLSSAAVEGRAAIPSPMAVTVDTNTELSAGLAGFGARPAQVGTTLAITTDDRLAAKLAGDTSCDAEHLEAFSVALSVASYRLPFAAVLGVANRVGASGREEWHRHQRGAGDAAVRAVSAWLGAGGAGAFALR
jgi:nucleoside phosphorylase